MLRLAFAQLRFRPGRSVVLVVVLVATVACFALVGASARTEQVTVHGTLEADSRAAYDLLVRPRLLAGKHVPGIGLNQVYEQNSVPQLPEIKTAMQAVATEEA